MDTTDAQRSLAGRLLVLQRKRVLITCEHCGVQSLGYPIKRFCDYNCRVRWHRVRQLPPADPTPALDPERVAS